MEIQNLLIVSAIVSAITALIKHYFGTEGFKSVIVSIVVSLIAGAAYYYAKGTAYWETFIQILAFASMIYGILIKQVQEKMKA